MFVLASCSLFIRREQEVGLCGGRTAARSSGVPEPDDRSHPQSFTLPQIAELAAIDYRTLHNWQKRGLLRASRYAANGSGSVNRLSLTDALQALILSELRRSGVEVRILESIADRVWELAVEIDEDRQLLVISHGSVTLSSNSELGAQISGDRPSVVLNMGRARRAPGSDASGCLSVSETHFIHSIRPRLSLPSRCGKRPWVSEGRSPK